MKKTFLFSSILFLLLCKVSVGQGIVYLTDNNGEPWGSTSCVDAMNGVFGNGNYTTSYYQNVNANNLFVPGNCFIYLEGGADRDILMNNFIAANQVLMQNWVNAGGHLILNSAGWNTDIACGFGGVRIVLLPAFNNTSTNGYIFPGQNAHPVFNNVTFPAGITWSGNWFSHDIILDNVGQPFIDGDVGRIATEQVYGSGKVIFSGMTSTSFHNPQPDADNLRKAILDYLKVCALPLPPNCALLLNPTTNETNVDCNDSLKWQVQGGVNYGLPSGYKLFYGTNNPPSNIENGTIINNTYYVPIAILPNTKYYWKIIATNQYGDAVGCNLDSFTTLTLPTALAGDEISLCGNIIQLNGNNPSPANGLWTIISGGGTIVNPTIYNTFVTNLNPGPNTFAWTINNGSCPPSTDQVIITALLDPIIADFSFSPTTTTADDSIRFKNLSTNSVSWSWDFGDNTTSSLKNPTHLFNDAGTFGVILIVTNSEGCTDSIQKTIIIEEEMYVPNIFTPNNDLSNDLFKIKSTGIKTYELLVFNRWGAKVFATNDSKTFWDGKDNSGKDSNSGTYYYILKATSKSGAIFDKTGFVTLLR